MTISRLTKDKITTRDDAPGDKRLLPFAQIVVVDDPDPHSAALNMALDEALLTTLGDVVVLRCYRWLGQAVSFGCFGHVAAARNASPAVPLVRRWTGGGIVEHGADFTFSLFIPQRTSLAVLPPRESYRLIHAAVASALGLSGFPGVKAAAATDASPREVVRAAPFLQPCFSNPVLDDLLLDGRKVAGGAQRRTRHGLLHQGSIQGVSRADLVVPDRLALEQNLIEILALAVTHRAFTPDECAAAAKLAATKYGSVAWTEKF